MNNSIDAKIINLYKLHIPKTKKFSDLVGNSKASTGDHRYYFTMGSYDLIDIEGFRTVSSIRGTDRAKKQKSKL